MRDDESALLRVWQRGETNSTESSHRDNKKGWVEHGVFRLDEVNIERLNGPTSKAKVHFGIGRELVARQVSFSDEVGALRFRRRLEEASRPWS